MKTTLEDKHHPRQAMKSDEKNASTVGRRWVAAFDDDEDEDEGEAADEEVPSLAFARISVAK